MLIVAVVAFTIVFIIVKRRKCEVGDMVLALDGNLSNSTAFVPEQVQTLNRDTDLGVFIKFPQIKKGYPDMGS